MLGADRLAEQDQQRLEFETTVARDLGGPDVGERWYRALRRRTSPDAAEANAFRFDWYLATARWSRDTHDARNFSPVLSTLHNQGHGTGSVGSISRFLVHPI